MKFHGIDMVGDFQAEIVVDASALAYDASDERRVVYDQTTKQLWIADDTEWKRNGDYINIPQGTEMWVYSDTAPTGWAIVAGPSDELLAVKGGGTYITGGTAAGSFTTPTHSHALASHVHSASGVALGNPPNLGKEATGGTGRSNQVHTHSLSLSVGGPSTTTSTDGSSTLYRPRARVGLICVRS